MEAPVYLAHRNAYEAVKQHSGNGATQGVEQAIALKALTEIPALNISNARRWIALFNAYKGNVKCTSVNGDKIYTTTEDTPRDSRIASVEFVFDDAEEAAKYFTNTIAKDAYAGDAVLTVNEAAAVDGVGGKVVIGMKLKITDVWGMEMVVPFNVEISTK